MNEVWKDIKDYPGYQVSNLGRIRTHNKVTSSRRFKLCHWKDRVIVQKISKDRNHRVDLWNENGHKTFLVHRIVAEAFLGEAAGMTVNHIDGNRDNNTIDNLEWLSLADNIRHGFRTGLYTSQKPVRLKHPEGNFDDFPSRASASRFLGRSAEYISHHIETDGIVYNIYGDSFIIEAIN